MASKLARRSRLRFDCDRHSVFGDTRSAFLLSCVATMFAAPAVPLRRQQAPSVPLLCLATWLSASPAAAAEEKSATKRPLLQGSSWVISLGLGGTIPTQPTIMDVKAARCLPPACPHQSSCKRP